LQGKLVFRETVTEGSENMTMAFIGMLCGENIGKVIVKV
jgi:NADPH-dependent curcumin reductase CurA